MQAPRFRPQSIAPFLVFALVLCAPTAAVSADPGDRDPLFGDDGRVSTDFFGRVDVAASAAIQPDGKVVVVGHSAHTADDSSLDFSLARYNADGTLDAEFGDGGKVTTDFAGDLDEAESVAIQPDGRIVVVGYVVRSTTGYDFGLARYMPDGTLDPEFGDGGKVTTDFARNDDVATAMALLPDGGVVAAGFNFSASTGEDFACRVFR
ncbi:MAG: hypothetical protein IPF53_11960 [Blastocatellia bacterium]|nr:hypothetical protein [Blastocatellia bacterium]